MLDIIDFLNEFFSVSRSVHRATSDKADSFSGNSNLEQLVERGEMINWMQMINISCRL